MRAQVLRLWEFAELSPRTFCTFPREFSSFRRQGLLTGGDRDPGHGSAHLLVRRAVPGSPGFAARRTGPWRPRGRNDGHAAASTDGHVAHDADRFASTRARRAAAARDVRSARYRVPCAEVHLVRRLSAKRRMRKHTVVFVEVEQLPEGPRTGPLVGPRLDLLLHAAARGRSILNARAAEDVGHRVVPLMTGVFDQLVLAVVFVEHEHARPRLGPARLIVDGEAVFELSRRQCA